MRSDGLDAATIVAGRDGLLLLAQEKLCIEPGVVGMFVAGSLAAGDADTWSDIDLRVIVDPVWHPTIVDRRCRIPQSWPGFMFNEWLPGTHHCVSHFRPFNKIDIFYWATDSLKPSPWLTLPIRILHDPTGIISRVCDASAGMSFVVDTEEVSRIISKGLATAHEAWRRISRGEILYANALIDDLRRYMVCADVWSTARTPPVTSCAGFERVGSSEIVDVLSGSFDGSGPQQLTAALARLLPVYQRQIVALHECLSPNRNLSDDLDALQRVARMLAETLTATGLAT